MKESSLFLPFLILACSPHPSGKNTIKRERLKDGRVRLVTYNEQSTKVEEVEYLEFDTGLVEDGRTTRYHNNGVRSIVLEYKKGKLQGEFVQYYDNGKVLAKGIYKSGLLHGHLYAYYRDGSMLQHSFFDETGEIGGQYFYDSATHLPDLFEMHKGEGKYFFRLQYDSKHEIGSIEGKLALVGALYDDERNSDTIGFYIATAKPNFLNYSLRVVCPGMGVLRSYSQENDFTYVPPMNTYAAYFRHPKSRGCQTFLFISELREKRSNKLILRDTVWKSIKIGE